MRDIADLIATELTVQPRQVRAAIDLLDGGATVPFVARYRKEATGGLDDTQLRTLESRLGYLRELAQRREVVLRTIAEQGRLTDALRAAIEAADTQQALEDLYLPYKPRRRTKAQMAREAGLEPLADAILADPTGDPQARAVPFVRPGKEEGGEDFTTVAAVLDGVRDILAERWAERAEVVQPLREWLWDVGLLRATLAAGKDADDPTIANLRDYFDYAEPIRKVPSHRALAVFRGRAQSVLDVRLVQPQEAPAGQPSLAEGRLAQLLGWSHLGRAADDLLRRCVAWTWRVKLSLSIERELFGRLREQAEAVAIQVFADNLRDLLLAAPAGPRVVMGLDPGIRTGVKVAVVDATGKLLDTATVYPHEPRRDWDGALAVLERLCRQHAVTLAAIGNGTASRETDRLVADLARRVDGLQRVVVSEAGASVYSASEYAAQEMPTVDVSLRGAASIARRLQDPLAELVKIDPKSIGVGQYQHDVNQVGLARTLEAVVEDCVNAVGVDLNTASAPLLARVSGLSASVARAVVGWRETHGAFRRRSQLLDVSGLGPKAYEQSAGFLRICGGDDPLDMTGVHPETYPLVEKILAFARRPVAELMGRPELLRTIRAESFADARFGVVTVRDILSELEKPGRDPRPHFKVARFNEGVATLSDLKPGMTLEGTVSNVAAFGAFVDLGVHQDGLIHVSELADRFVNDAREVVKTGDIVKVRVLEVDAARKRISLSMRSGAGRRAGDGDANRHVAAPRGQRMTASASAPTVMSAAFQRLRSGKSH